MSKKRYNQSLFIFRRDLRLQDNTGLLEALQQSEVVLPCFIATPEQLDTAKNKYKSDNCVQFMCKSLQDLDQQLQDKKTKLFLFIGSPEPILKEIYKNYSFDALFVNQDYTPYSLQRDETIERYCSKKNIAFNAFQDYTLNPVDTILNKQGRPYKVFTSFYKTAQKHPVEAPQKNTFNNYVKSISFPSTITASFSELKKYFTYNHEIMVKGGRSEGKKLLKRATSLTTYKQEKDYLTTVTSLLSAHNKFGTLSIREVYHALAANLGKTHELIRQLYWRDFFYTISFYFPQVFHGSFNEKFRNIPWKNNKQQFELWKTGMTGFPVVDACMRALNTTGFMPNRGRMIVASFLCKDLHINWRWGERYFATKLVDYDPAQNNGNWQWVASTGVDASPYFRIFNPWEQSKKYDPQAIFIKKWIPELKDIPANHLHRWNKYYQQYSLKNYPAPITQHSKASQQIKMMYKSA